MKLLKILVEFLRLKIVEIASAIWKPILSILFLCAIAAGAYYGILGLLHLHGWVWFSLICKVPYTTTSEHHTSFGASLMLMNLALITFVFLWLKYKVSESFWYWILDNWRQAKRNVELNNRLKGY